MWFGFFYRLKWTCFDYRFKTGFFFAMMVLLGSFSGSTWAETTTKVTSNLSAGSQVVHPSDYFWQILLSLVLVLLIIFLAAFLLRRYAHVNGALNGQLKVLGGLALGQREKVVLIQVGEQQLLVGVTSTEISLLHQLKHPIELEAQGSNATLDRQFGGAFAQKLQQALKNTSHSDKS